MYNSHIFPELEAIQHFSILGLKKVSSLPLYAITHPLMVLKATTYHLFSKISYIILLIIPPIFILKFDIKLLIPIIPWFLLSFLSNYPPYYTLGYQYPAYVMPFILLASFEGFSAYCSKLGKRHAANVNTILVSILFLNIIFSLIFSPMSPILSGRIYSPPYDNRSTDREHIDLLSNVIKLVPHSASILTQDNLFPHFSSRLNAYVIPIPIEKNTSVGNAAREIMYSLQPDFILIDLKTDYLNKSMYAFNLLNDQKYGLVAYVDEIYLFERNYRESPLIFIKNPEFNSVQTRVLLNRKYL